MRVTCRLKRTGQKLCGSSHTLVQRGPAGEESAVPAGLPLSLPRGRDHVGPASRYDGAVCSLVRGFVGRCPRRPLRQTEGTGRLSASGRLRLLQVLDARRAASTRVIAAASTGLRPPGCR